MNNRLHKRYKEINEEIASLGGPRDPRTEWQEGYYHALHEEAKFLWHILFWYKVDIEEQT